MEFSRKSTLAGVLLMSLGFAAGAGEMLKCGFEDGLSSWTVNGKEMVSICDSDAASGAKSLQIDDESDSAGASVESAFIPAPKGLYKISGMQKCMKGYGPGIYFTFYDANKKYLGSFGCGGGSQPRSTTEWVPFSFFASSFKDDTAFFKLKIGSGAKEMNNARVDDVTVELLPPGPIPPPWKAQYKIKPDEKAKLTAADVIGPDGVVYPNWSRAGVQGGIPDLKGAKTVRIEDFGGLPDDKKGDAEAIEKAVASLGAKGGVVQFGKGSYTLERPIAIYNSNIVLRGEGMDATKIEFIYAIPSDGIDFYGLKDGDALNFESNVNVYCRPDGLKEIRLKLDGEPIGSWQRSKHSGNSFSLVVPLEQLRGKAKTGAAKLLAEASYDGGKTVKKLLNIKLTENPSDAKRPLKPLAAILISGEGPTGGQIALAANGKRGDMELALASEPAGIAPGDLICVNAPETERRREETRNSCNWGLYRNYLVFVKGVAGRKLLLDQPLRIDFPAVDGSFVRKMKPIERCGIEDMTIDSVCDLWFTTVLFRNALNCWAQGVKVVKCGRNPVYADNAKFCSIRNCVFDDAWFKGGGGTAYAGWEKSYDCLMENVETFKMRHAPLFQWSASGNVIRNGVFHDSDAQWHSGWTNENLFENCVVLSDTTSNGGYGYGMWASPPEDSAHGPNGPRNAIYNCDVRSNKTGLWLGGMNENWIIAHNRFQVANGQGIFLKTFGFDHIIKGNAFVLKDAKSVGVTLSSQDCAGVELSSNTLYGGCGKMTEGLIEPLVETDSKILPYDAKAPRPKPAVPSIYEWQVNNAKR